MKIIEDVDIPLVKLPFPEINRLVKWHVRDGSHVTVGEVIFTLEIENEEYDFESFYTGYIKITAPVGSEHKVGDSIGTMVCEANREGYRMFGVELSEAQIARLDALRGQIPRRMFLWKFVGDALEQIGISEQFMDDNPS